MLQKEHGQERQEAQDRPDPGADEAPQDGLQEALEDLALLKGPSQLKTSEISQITSQIFFPQEKETEKNRPGLGQVRLQGLGAVEDADQGQAAPEVRQCRRQALHGGAAHRRLCPVQPLAEGAEGHRGLVCEALPVEPLQDLTSSLVQRRVATKQVELLQEGQVDTHLRKQNLGVEVLQQEPLHCLRFGLHLLLGNLQAAGHLRVLHFLAGLPALQQLGPVLPMPPVQDSCHSQQTESEK